MEISNIANTETSNIGKQGLSNIEDMGTFNIGNMGNNIRDTIRVEIPKGSYLGVQGIPKDSNLGKY